MTTNYIFVTGGVVSSLVKALPQPPSQPFLKPVASMYHHETGSVHQRRSRYYEPNPHGEVFVTEDGAETDLDLGH